MIKKEGVDRTWSYDICVAKELPIIENGIMESIIRNSKGNNIDGGDSYTWNELGQINKGEKWFRELEGEKRKEIINEIIQKKIKSKKLTNKDDDKYKTSSQIFLEVYNEKTKLN